MLNGRLSGKVVIVTGAASGIGLATASRFTAEGARVVGADIATGVDVTDARAVDVLVAGTVSECGRIDALAHFAGITRDAMAHKMTLEAWEEVLRVNLTGSFLIAQAVSREMRKQGSGSIVLTSSRSYLGNLGQANYAASKGGVVSLTRTLALELGRFNVRVNALAPGYIATPMTMTMPEHVRARAIEGTPIQRAGTPDDVAAAALFLVSDESTYITGTVLPIDGGRTTGVWPA